MTGISRESERMSLLVDDLLLLARLDDGRPLERVPVQLDEVVGEAVETAQAVEPDRPIELDTDPAVVIGDRDRLRQIVDNLLSNVRAHTPPGTPVSVSVRRQNGTAEIAVTDSGPGLEEEHLAHVFERFYRADSSRARASGGVGRARDRRSGRRSPWRARLRSLDSGGGQLSRSRFRLPDRTIPREITRQSDLGRRRLVLPPWFYEGHSCSHRRFAFDADEIIVATTSASRSGWLAREAVRRAQARYPRRVRHVVVGHDQGEAAAA